MNQIMQHPARLWRARGGIAAVEFAIILPLLVLLLFGTIEIGRILFDYQAASKSVRDATRYLIPTALIIDLCGPNLSIRWT